MAKVEHIEGRNYNLHFTENEELLTERDADTRSKRVEACIEEYIVQRLDELLHGFE